MVAMSTMKRVGPRINAITVAILEKHGTFLVFLVVFFRSGGHGEDTDEQEQEGSAAHSKYD
jgi:hypothetical protein